jgi:integrase/recombinase XerC
MVNHSPAFNSDSRKEDFIMKNDKMTYRELTDTENILKLREVLQTLPVFTKDFFRSISTTTTTKTRISYAYDIRIFFQFLIEQNPAFKNMKMTDFDLSVLDQIKALDIEEYLEYLKAYKDHENEDQIVTNGERGLKRKLSALRSFYAYYYKMEMIQTNPTVLVDIPKIHEKTITRLDADEVALLLDYVEHAGDKLTGQKKAYYEKTKVRDLALITLLLGTGIRVSECVGLDIEDVDFKNNGIKVVRKGGNEMIIYFGPEVETALKAYIEEREQITPLPGQEHALFYSTQRKRIGVKAVENLVKKYAREVTTTKHITPHKLRSTYGTSLYQETGDIYLVADVLGHKDVNTTKKHYAAMDDARRRKAATAVKLRESGE